MNATNYNRLLKLIGKAVHIEWNDEGVLCGASGILLRIVRNGPTLVADLHWISDIPLTAATIKIKEQ